MTVRLIPVLGLLAGLASAENLLPNGDFERADPADAERPLGWDRPDGLAAAWLPAPEGGQGKALRLDTRLSEQAVVASWRRAGLTDFDIPGAAKNAVADTYGLSFYSATAAVVKGQAYKLGYRFHGPKGGVKVWVRGYGLGRDGVMRRLYEAVSNGDAHVKKEEAGGWHSEFHCFHPTRVTPGVTGLRVMLYAYHPAASYWFDDLRLEPISTEEFTAYRARSGVSATAPSPLLPPRQARPALP